jgi:glyoxylase-like metal-dependent hydrolase (beta-lactamase superfamily II)
MSDFTRWTIGKVSITKLPEIEIVIPYNADAPFLPDATPEALARIDGVCPNYITHDGALRMSFHALLVDAPGLRLVVDTCIGNDRAREYLCEEPLQTGFLEDLTAVGWPPDSVDAVLCTHMHVDHVGWNTRLENGAWVPTFPNATYFFFAQRVRTLPQPGRPGARDRRCRFYRPGCRRRPRRVRGQRSSFHQ